MELNRRQFVTGAAVTVAGTLGLSAMGAGSVAATRSPAALPPPEQSGIDHIVVVMMENRSFDHYLGWLPGADGKQDGLSYLDNSGRRHATHHLDTFTGCGHPDPDHSYEGGRVQYNGGACDGFLRSGRNDEFAIGYYSATDLDFFGRAARDWTTCDRYFAAVMGPTFPNRFFQHLVKLGLKVLPHPFADHHAFSPRDLEFGDDLPVLMTEKDAVKLRHAARPEWWVLPVTAKLDPAFGDWLLGSLNDLRRRKEPR